MSEEPKEEHARAPEEQRRRTLPKGAAKPGPRSGWIILAVIAVTFLAMRLMNPNRPQVNEISQTEFRALVEEGHVQQVKRVRALDSGCTYIAGELKGDESAKPVKFRVNLVPGENEKLM